MYAGDIAWEASPKQNQLLSATEYEVLYGGAAGGGKSDALLIDAWCIQYGGPQNPNHRGALFRRSFPELKDLIDRAREIYPQFIPGIKYDSNDHRFTTPDGGKVEFAYLNNDQDRFKYRGRAFNYLGFDELTLWPTSTCYEYLLTRNRTTDKSLPRFVRATTNPDGPGQKWVMERWGISEEGHATLIRVPIEAEIELPSGEFVMRQVEVMRRFIPAKLSDNKHLRGTGYRESLLLQSDKEVTEALLEGLWVGNRVKGAVYLAAMQRMRQENRLTQVPWADGIPVNTFWDLGYNDTTAIWLHQQVGPQNRFVQCFENSGVGNDYYVRELQRIQSERGIVYGTHYLPHDSEHHSRQTAKTDIEAYRKLWPGQRFTPVARTKRKITAIQQTRACMSTVWIDREGCADGIAALDAFRFKYDDKLGTYGSEPLHDWSSNFATAFQQFAQGYEGVAGIAEKAANPDWKRELLRKKRNSRTS